MLPLKYLVHNQELALSILSRWEHDQDQLHLLERFRISANAVYPFKYAGELRFLRFAPLCEKPADDILAELDWISFLRASGYPCLAPVLSKQSRQLEIVETPWGVYAATAFTAVPGKSLESFPMTEELIQGWGKSLGRLHRLSRGFQPAGKRRPSYRQHLQWMDDMLQALPGEELARQELTLVSEWLDSLPQDSESFGLIHYDFETDNVFHDPVTGAYHAIDFDDAVYHWLMMDVTVSLMSYADETSAEELGRAMPAFVAGYRTEHRLDDIWLERMPGFRRYLRLYGYLRILYAAHEPVADQPDWMERLRGRLDALLKRRSADFGKPIR